MWFGWVLVGWYGSFAVLLGWVVWIWFGVCLVFVWCLLGSGLLMGCCVLIFVCDGAFCVLLVFIACGWCS